MLLVGVLVVAAVVALGIALAWGANDQEELARVARTNCEQIEALKAVVRPDPFDEVETRAILTDLNLDPASDHAQRLIESARRNNARERRELAPKEC
jgi:hypothetical protein